MILLSRVLVSITLSHTFFGEGEAAMIETIQSFLLNPNIVFLLFVVAMLGLYAEISNPGTIVPGVLGAIALLVFFFAATALSPNWLGLIFMGLAFLFLILDVHASAHGFLTAAAVVSLIFGTFLFFQNSTGSMPLQPWLVYIMGALVGALGLLLLSYVLRVRRLPVTTGTESMVGTQATAITPLRPLGRVSYGGENWEATLETPDSSVDEGGQVQIMQVDGLRLRVRPVHTSSERDQSSSSF
jgi:membrane-bound serine protease (ClpP class)